MYKNMYMTVYMIMFSHICFYKLTCTLDTESGYSCMKQWLHAYMGVRVINRLTETCI